MKNQKTDLKDIKKFNFKDIKGILNRDQMKQIKGGSGSGGCNAGGTCGAHQICQNGTCVGCVYC